MSQPLAGFNCVIYHHNMSHIYLLFLFVFRMPIFDRMLDTVNFILLGTGYVSVIIIILELRYLETF